MNRTIKFLMLSDTLVLSGLGLVTPILAIFIKDNVTDGTVAAAGLATFLYLITKCVVQLPLARYTDLHVRSKRGFLIIGTLLMALSAFLLVPVTSVNGVYATQLLRGIGAGLANPCWLSLWSVHLDRHHEGYEWSIYDTYVGVGTAISAAIGASLAQLLGFSATFLIVGTLTLLGGVLLLALDQESHA